MVLVRNLIFDQVGKKTLIVNQRKVIGLWVDNRSEKSVFLQSTYERVLIMVPTYARQMYQ